MDPLSITASIIAVLQATAKVGEALRDAKDSSTDRIQFTTDISNLSNLLVSLLSRLDESSPEPWHANVRALGGQDGLIYQYRVELEQLKDKISVEHGVKKMSKILLWRYVKEDAERIMLRIERLKSLVQLALENDHFKLSEAIQIRVRALQDDSQAVKGGVSALQQDQSNQMHRTIMDWLSSDDFSAQHADLIARREPDTGRWFLDTPEFTEWAHGSTKTLFCPGIPGAGKTMMAAIAVDHLLNVVQTSEVGVVHIYCNYKRQSDQTTSNLLAAILKQLVQDRPPLAEPLSSLYDHHQMRRTRPSLQEYFGALSSVLGKYSKVYVVADALDECLGRDGTRSQLLKILRDLQGQGDLHLMATSRHIPEIEGEFKGMPWVEVRASKADVERYVLGKIGQLPPCVQGSRDLQEYVTTKIAEAVDGMFLLARLHVDSLSDKRTKAKVMKALNSLSRGSGALDDAYSEAIVRIDGQLQDDRTLAKKVLSWISYAKRPLTTEELCHALAVEVGDENLDMDNILDIEDILSVCAGLVTVDEESQIIRLVHYTTQDYLEGIRETWNPDAELDIASTCLTYLCFEPFRSGPCLSDEEYFGRVEEYVFLHYLAKYWCQHVAIVQEQTLDLAMVFLKDGNNVDCVVQLESACRYGYDQYRIRRRTGLHLVAWHGLLYLCNKLLAWAAEMKVLEVDARDSASATPLMLAARAGHSDVVELLLSTGKADVKAKDAEGRTALMFVASKGYRDTVELLLSTGKADVEAKDCVGMTALMFAASNGHKDTVELLLSTGKADVEAKDINGWTLLMFAANNGHKDTVELLLSTGKADVEAKDKEGMTLLMFAAKNGHKETVKLLLSTGKVDLDARNCIGRTALLVAASSGHEAIVETLLQTSVVNINARGGRFGDTPLLVAVRRGHQLVVQTLLSRQNIIDVDARDSYGSTALLVAASSGHEAIVEMLLQTSVVDINARGGYYGDTPLLVAVRYGIRLVVQTLLSRENIIVDVKDDEGWTPLTLAARWGRKDIVQMLLDTGKADVDLRNGSGLTALEIAEEKGQAEVARVLRAHRSLK